MKQLLTFLATILVLAHSGAAELMNLEIDFGAEGWDSVVKPLWGNNRSLVKEDGVTWLKFGPHAFNATPLIPVPVGSTIKIEFDAMTTAIPPSGEAWRTAAVQLGLFDGDKEQSHLDLFNTGKPTGRKRYVSSTPIRNNGFRLCFGNYGKDGEFRIANLKITVEVPGTNVEQDGSFQGMFGINDWFVQNGGKDWDGIGLGRAANAAVKKDLFPTPGGTLCLNGEATVISRLFPYNGEGLVVGAWFSQQGVETSTMPGRPWANAGIQLVYYDADDRVVGHSDVTPRMIPGDRPWSYQLLEIPPGGLNRQVKSVALWLRLFGGAKGKAWIDDVALIKQGEGQARNYNTSQGTIRIGGAAEAVPLNRVWNGVDLSYCSQIDLPQVQTALRRLKEEAGLEYLRTREFFNGPHTVTAIDAAGNITFDFSGVDRYLDFPVRELGLKLVPTLETIPPALRTAENSHVPRDFDLWGKAVKGLVKHWIERYGKETVSEWIFECWNEPGSDFFRGSDEEFCKLFVTYLRALTEVEKEMDIKLHIGTPSGAMNQLLSRVLEAADEAGLAGAVTDGSTHIYGGFSGSMEYYRLGVENIRKRMEPFANGRQIPIHVTEFNGSAMSSHHFDTQTGGAFVVKANRMMADLGVTRSYFYCVIDHPYLNLENHYSGDLGYMTHYDAVPKASFNAVVLLNRLAGKRLPVVPSSEPFDAMAAIDGDGTVRVVATTFSEEEPDVFKPVPVTLEIDWTGRPEKLETAELVRIDSTHGNSYSAFDKAGRPSAKTSRDTSAMQEASRLTVEPLTGWRFENGKLIVPLTMELNSVAAVTLK